MNVWELIGKLGEAMITKKDDDCSQDRAESEKKPDENKTRTSSGSSDGYSSSLPYTIKPRKQTVEDMLRRHAEISKRIDENNKPESE